VAALRHLHRFRPPSPASLPTALAPHLFGLVVGHVEHDRALASIFEVERDRRAFAIDDSAVELVNTTAERDGSRRRYFLRVPSETRSGREAVAWSLELNARDYEVAVET
jgi:hypothetical protein